MYSVIDLETTGSHARHHGITEVAIVNFDGKEIAGEFHSLIRPKQEIPAFISHFTGITGELVSQAPAIEEVLAEIDAFTQQRILVAHNAQFDYSFLKSNFIVAGIPFQRKLLCTLRLTKLLFPGLRSYSLDSLCRHFGLEAAATHRALQDARAALALLRLLLREDKHGTIPAMLRKNAETKYPPHISREQITVLPEKPGVYYFRGADGQVLYVGKANNLRSRVIQHFISGSDTRQRTRLMNAIRRIDYELCGNELIAMLKESAEIKKFFPPFNVAQKFSHNNYGLYPYVDGKGYQRLALKRLTRADRPVVSFFSLQEARRFIREKVQAFHLCPKLCGLQRSPGACYDHQAGLCDGACCEAVLPSEYNERMEQMLASATADSLTCAILGDGRTGGEFSFVVVDRGRYLGYGFLPFSNETQGYDYLKQHVLPQPDNSDVQWIIRFWIRSERGNKTLFPAAQTAASRAAGDG